MKTKIAFEMYTRTHGVTVLNHHADNDRFADNAFKLKQNSTIKKCHIVVSMPTIKMAGRKNGSGTYRIKRK